MWQWGALLVWIAAHGAPTEAPAPATTSEPMLPAPRADQPVVVVWVPAQGVNADRVAETLMAHLAAGDLRVVLDRSGPPSEASTDLRESLEWAAEAAREHNAVGVLWVDVSQPDQLVLSSANATGERVLTRLIPADPQSPAAALEALGIIARTTSLALAAGHEIGIRPVDRDVVTVRAKTAPPRRPPSWPHVILGLEYVGGNYAEQFPWQHGVAAQVLGRPIPKLVFGVGYTFVIPATAQQTEVALEIQRNPVAVLCGYHQDLGQRGSVELMGSLSLDPIRAHAVNVEPPLVADDPSTRLLVGAGAATRWEIRTWRELGVYLSVGVEVLLTTFDYVIRDEDGGSHTLLSPHRMRGLAAVGIRYGLAKGGKIARVRRRP